MNGQEVNLLFHRTCIIATEIVFRIDHACNFTEMKSPLSRDTEKTLQKSLDLRSLGD